MVIINVILTYLSNFVAFLFLQLFFYRLAKDIPRFNKHMFFLSVFILWSFFLFNVIYTGLMGWNQEPESQLEYILDIISASGIIVACIMMVHSAYCKKW